MFEGTHIGVLERLGHAEIEQRFPDDARRGRQREPGFGPGGGGSLEAFSARCLAIFKQLAQTHAGQTIAIVAHGGVLDCPYRAANGIGLQASCTWLLANPAINPLLYTGGRLPRRRLGRPAAPRGRGLRPRRRDHRLSSEAPGPGASRPRRWPRGRAACAAGSPAG
ncbi:MAG: histidine phosphatase family protein [Ideonella sp. WA131b]|nr:histidine phosphatase family protein [Ideonella sp. WA131b]